MRALHFIFIIRKGISVILILPAQLLARRVSANPRISQPWWDSPESVS
jgi:hypothetical protein